MAHCIAVIQIETIVTGNIILIGSLRCLKEAKTMGHDTGFKCKFKFSFLIFSNICCWYTLELPHRGNSNVHLQHMSFQ